MQNSKLRLPTNKQRNRQYINYITYETGKLHISSTLNLQI
jgi:hypothetical protein